MNAIFRGDFKALEQLQRQMTVMASPAVRRAILVNMAEESLTQIRLGFERVRDPMGQPWEPLKHPSRKRGGSSAKPLQDTGRLKNSFKQHVTNTGFVVDSDVEYAGVHQDGARIAHGAGQVVQHLNGRFAKRSTKSHNLIASKRKAYVQRIPARPMVPEGESPGPIWSAALAKAGRDTLESFVGAL